MILGSQDAFATSVNSCGTPRTIVECPGPETSTQVATSGVLALLAPLPVTNGRVGGRLERTSGGTTEP